MADDDESVRKFIDITGVDEQEARELLAENTLEVAIHNFFGGIRSRVEMPEEDELEELPVPLESKNKSKTSESRFKTVANLNHDSSSDSDEGGQAFYAGGSTHSGQQVLGPGRSRNQIVADMFRSVREHGGEIVEEEIDPRKPNTFKFAGTGYKLGQTSDDTEVVNPGHSSTSDKPRVTITLKMWRQGFSINEGSLRDYKEPDNMQFLKTVSRGIIPEELLQQARGSEVHLNMEDHSSEDYVFTKPKLKAFSGKGNVLGSPVPATAGTAPPTTGGKATAEEQSSLDARAREAVPLDASQPTTSVQIRLADGSRLIASFNHTNTVADLRTYIATARPEYARSSFRLLTTFPSKELSDDSATLKDAGILNSALLQRL